MAEPPFDIQRAHRWFAVELNNLAWDLVEAGARGREDTERMIHAAHASCYHWLQAGSASNHQRALCLLATAYGAAGLPREAARHAERCMALSRENAGEQTPFDRATALGCAARAHAALGRAELARDLHRQALEIAASFQDADDRSLFDRLYPAP